MKTRRKYLLPIALLILLIGTWLSWKWYDSRYPTWDEEVQLSDGRVILVTQKHKYFDNYGTDQSWVTFSLPEMGGKQTWHSYLKPMHLDVYQGVVYVFGRPRGPKQVAFYQYPKYLMVAFKWNGADFERIPFANLPDVIRQEENLFSCVPQIRRGLISLAVKNRDWCPPSSDKGQLTKKINLEAYQELATAYARLDGGSVISE